MSTDLPVSVILLPSCHELWNGEEFGPSWDGEGPNPRGRAAMVKRADPTMTMLGGPSPTGACDDIISATQVYIGAVCASDAQKAAYRALTKATS
jgi:hypothetical protein